MFVQVNRTPEGSGAGESNDTTLADTLPYFHPSLCSGPSCSSPVGQGGGGRGGQGKPANEKRFPKDTEEGAE